MLLAIASCTYYAWRLAIDDSISMAYLATVGLAWTATAAVTGAIAGYAGSRSRVHSAYWAVPAGSFAGEVAAIAILSRRWPQLIVEASAAGICLWAGRAHFRTAILATMPVATLVAACAIAYRVYLHPG